MSEDDMMKTIVPKSDQLNADDLVGGHTITIKINHAEVKETGEQKVILGYEGDNGKPYKPGKMMCHVLIGLYGKSSKNYVGKSLTLYRDDAVTFGPNTVGGVRIRYASHIDHPVTVIVPVSKGIRKPFTVKPLVVADTPNADDWIADIESVPTLDGLKHKYSQAQKLFKDSTDFARIHAAKEKRKLELTPAEEPKP